MFCKPWEPVLALFSHLCAQALLLLSEFGRELGTEVVGLGGHLADLDLGVVERGALETFDRLAQ